MMSSASWQQRLHSHRVELPMASSKSPLGWLPCACLPGLHEDRRVVQRKLERIRHGIAHCLCLILALPFNGFSS